MRLPCPAAISSAPSFSPEDLAGQAHHTSLMRDAGFPDKKLLPRREAKRARIRMRDRADQVEDAPRRPSPIDAAVGGTTASEITATTQVLLRPRRAAGDDQRMVLANDLGAERHQLAIQRQRGVAVVDRARALRHDVAGVGARHHIMKRHARLALAIDEHPIHRRAAAILRQQRAMEIECADRRGVQNRVRQQVAIVDRIDDVGMQRDGFRDDVRIDALRGEDRNRVSCRELGARAPPDLLVRIILKGEQRGDRRAEREQRLHESVAGVVIREQDASRALHRSVNGIRISH